MASTVEDIKARLNIVDLVAERTRVRRTGASVMANCPFHADKTPSLSIAPDKGVWHCFSCNRGGDIVTFVMEMEGLEFRDALELLARRAGVELRYERPAERSRRSRLLAIHEQAVRYFWQALKQSAGGRRAYAYLKKRGLTDESLNDFKIGYAPFAWGGLTTALKGRGFTDDELAASGLAIRPTLTYRERRVYDRFRARIMFPIANAHGDVIAFTGRIFEAGLPAKERARAAEAGKYVNSPNTILYEKKRVLYGFDKAKQAIRQKNEAILLEGNLDVILSHQAGVLNAVATSGTALGEEHLAQLKNLAEQIVFCFDADMAGAAATRRALGLALTAGFRAAAILITKGKDPADVVKENPAEWRRLVEAKQEIMAFFLAQAQAQFDLSSARGKHQFGQYLFEPLANLPSRIERDHWLQTIAQALKLNPESVTADFNRYLSRRAPGLNASPTGNLPTDRNSPPQRFFQTECEANALSIMLKYPAEFRALGADLKKEFFTQGRYQSIFEKARAALAKIKTKAPDWLKIFPDEQPAIEQLLLRADHFFPTARGARDELAKGAAFLHNEWYRREYRHLSIQLEQANARGDFKLAAKIERLVNLFLKSNPFTPST